MTISLTIPLPDQGAAPRNARVPHGSTVKTSRVAFDNKSLQGIAYLREAMEAQTGRRYSASLVVRLAIEFTSLKLAESVVLADIKRRVAKAKG